MSPRCTRRSFVRARPLWPPPSPLLVSSRRRVCSRATPTVPDVGPLKVGWSTIYTTPSWMTETQNEIEAEIERPRSGHARSSSSLRRQQRHPTQIAQIQTMIDQAYDIVLLIAGSATALDQVCTGTRGGPHCHQLG